MTITELIKELEFQRRLYGDNVEIAVWNDEIKDYLDFYIRTAGKRISKSNWTLGLLYMYIHPIITDKKFHYFEYINDKDNNYLSKEELMTPLEKFNKKYDNK